MVEHRGLLQLRQPVGGCTFKRVDESERHICHQCARSVHDEIRKIMPAPATT